MVQCKRGYIDTHLIVVFHHKLTEGCDVASNHTHEGAYSSHATQEDANFNSVNIIFGEVLNLFLHKSHGALQSWGWEAHINITT